MEWRDLVLDAYSRVMEALDEALNGLDRDDLDRLPGPESNSMGWLAWHLSRIQDAEIASLMGEDQLWTSDGWHARFNRPLDPEDTGTGHTPEQVSAFRSPGIEALLDYHRAVLDRSRSYIASLSTSDLRRELDEPWYHPRPTVGVRVISVASDCLQHVGQVAYARGLLKGRGWLPY
ncbi:MAG: DinB family protein [Dehalococcoidia bacterium]|nr:DinB family protein [Dehalococcoidia bacterium]